MEKEYNLSPLSKSEISIILESLLTNGTVNVCPNWYDEHFNEMLNIAKNIRKNFPEILTTNLSFCETDIDADECGKFFPEIDKLNF